MRSVLFVVLVACAVACGGKSSGGSACVAPSGEWSITLTSDDPECGSETLEGVELEKVSEGDGCAVTSQSFEDSACVFMQRARCEGFTSTLVITLNDGGTRIASGTSTIEADDGTACDFEVKGAK